MSNMNKNRIVIIVVVLVVILLGGGVFMMNRNKANKAIITPTPSAELPSGEPTPTIEEEVDISTFQVKVLNGTTIAGLAAKVETTLETAGFTVSGIGNADTKTHTEVTIQKKTTVPASVIDKLEAALGSSYTIGPSEDLDDTDENDIIVILGSKVVPTTAPTVKPTTASTITITPTTTVTTPTPTLTPTPTPRS